MKIEPSNLVKSFKTGIFAALDIKKEELLKSGKKVYNFFVGTPDFEVFEHVKNTLAEEAKKPENYHYSLRDMQELKEAVADYYRRRFNADVKPSEVVSVNGSQEGLSHIGMALLNPGDIILLPNPGYPAFMTAAAFAGAEPYYYELREENGFLPVLEEIPEEVAEKAKAMIVSYPYNPVCSVATPEFYDKLIAFAKKHNIIIIHDNAYSDIIYDGAYGGSFLEHEGAKDIGVEFFSLSKSFNLTGARISFIVGNQDIINAFTLLKTQYDFGMFYPVQKAAIAALTGPLDEVKEQCRKYQARRDALCGGFRKIGWNVRNSEGTMFAWARIPEGFSSSQEFVLELAEKTGVLVTPGDAFGSMGEGYVRFALVCPVDVIEEAIKAVDESGILKRK